MNFYSTAYLWKLLRRQYIDRVLFLGDFTLPDEDWANFLAIDAETLTSILNFFLNQQFYPISH